MYCGVPRDIPVSVIRVPPALLAARAMPKSATSALPSCSRMFSGSDIAVDHPAAMRIVERAGDLVGDPDRVGDRQLLLARQPVAERLPVDVRHDVEEKGVGRPRIEERQDVRMLQVRRGLDLGEEPLGADHGGQFRPQHLDGNPAVVPQVLREVDRCHAAGTQLPLDAVAVGKRGREALRGDRGHAVLRAPSDAIARLNSSTSVPSRDTERPRSWITPSSSR